MGPQDPKDLFERRRRKVGDTHRGKESDQRCTRVGLNNQNNVFAVEQRCFNVGSLIKVREGKDLVLVTAWYQLVGLPLD